MRLFLSFYYPPFNSSVEPTEGNVRGWLDTMYAKFQPLEQSRWNQANIDTLFHAGAQNFVNQHFGSAQPQNTNNFYFNLVQQPCNIITGYQRQHRKSINYVPADGSDPNTTDQYTRVMTHLCNGGDFHEVYSRACELAAITGMVMMQPYLDYSGDDPAQGTMKWKLWEYNSFLVDPFFRSHDASDAQFFWFQEYISKEEAEARFPDNLDKIRPMAGNPQQNGNFYFLPENYNMAKNNLMVISYVWYKWKRKKKRLYSKSRNQFFDFAGGDGQAEAILYHINDFEVVEVEVPTWKLATVLNDQLMYNGDNPLGNDDCPVVPIFWNYSPEIGQYPELRCRGLVRPMRSSQYLFNWKVINNHDIAAATINAGWKRKSGAVANEDNLKKSGQGYDVIINEGYELSDVEKIIPSAVPASDLELASQMKELLFATSGIDMENWSGQDDKQISSLTALIKQAANLTAFQKYFDQWDYSLKLLGGLMLNIILNNWNAAKIGLILNEEPTEHFFSRIFAKYSVTVEEGLLTPTQRNFQAQQMLEINERFGREVLPASMIIKNMNLQGKAEIMEYLQQQEEQQSVMAQEKEHVQDMLDDAKVKEMYSKVVSNMAMARERHGREASNLGLYEERLSEITRNRALANKDKVDALAKLVETIDKFGTLETKYAEIGLDTENEQAILREDVEKEHARAESSSNEFISKLMSGSIPGVTSDPLPMQSGQNTRQNQPEFGQNTRQNEPQFG